MIVVKEVTVRTEVQRYLTLSEAKIVIKNACMTTYIHDGVHRPPSQLTSNSVSYETVLYDQSIHLSAIKNR